jgi:hypothetical protein
LCRGDRTLQQIEFFSHGGDLPRQPLDLGLLRRQEPFGRLQRSRDLLLKGLKFPGSDCLVSDGAGYGNTCNGR